MSKKLKSKIMNIYGKNKPRWYNGYRIVIEDKKMTLDQLEEFKIRLDNWLKLEARI